MKFINILIFLLDFIFIVLFYFFVAKIRGNLDSFGLSNFSIYAFYDSFLFFVIIMLTLFYEKIYTLRFDFWEETKLTLQALLLSFVIILSILMLSRINQEYSRAFFIMYFLGLSISFPLYKRAIKKNSF